MRIRSIVGTLGLLVLVLGGGWALAQVQSWPGTIVTRPRSNVRGYVDFSIRVPASASAYLALGRTGTWSMGNAPTVVNCGGAYSDWAPTSDWTSCSGGTQSRGESRIFTVTQNPQNGGTACPSPLTETRTVTQSCSVSVPPTTPIWGTAPSGASLGTCSLAVHEAYVLPGGDGYNYRTWHPQVDPSGCVFGHEHGDTPNRMTYAEIRALPIRFGYIARRHPILPNEPNGHDEAHEGYKVFVALPGDVNDEGRVNRVYSRSVFHMGTAGPARFAMPMHSADVAVYHPEFGIKAYTQLMMNTGGVDVVCDPRHDAPIKDVVSLQSRCKLNSFYEIWSTQQSVMYQGQEVYRSFVTPAVFDPITVYNPSTPSELVYAWDTRVNAILNFPGNDRTGFRGCDRENYAQPGYWYNAGQYATGRTTFYTDPMGLEAAQADADALPQYISAHHNLSSPATNDGLVQFKKRVDYCGGANKSKLGLKN